MAFHPYPRLIPSVFNPSGFGPPRGLTPASAWPRIDHPASRPRNATVLAILKTRFRCGSLRSLTSPHAVTRWLILQKARRHTVRCSGRLRARGFRYCFTPLAGCFSPFPHGTGSLSVTGECLALEGGPPCFPPGFTCPAVLRVGPRGGWGFAYGALTRCGRPSHAVPLPHPFLTAPRVPGPGPGPPATPDGNRPGALPPIGFGLVRFRSPLLAQSRLISLPPGT